MPRSSRRGAIPSELAWLIDELDDMTRRLATLEQPSGSQTNSNTALITRQIAYLASLKTYNDTGANFTVSNITADGTFRYFNSGATQPNATEMTIDVPTGKMLVSGAVGEVSLTPPGDFAIAQVGVFVTDANGASITIGTAGCYARLYTNMRFGQSLRTNDALVTIPDPIANPGPYRVRLNIGLWGVAGAPGTITCAVSQPALTVQIIGDGLT